MRLIDADKISGDLNELVWQNGNNKEYLNQIMFALSCIENAKEVDAEPVVHAKWENAKVKGYLCCSNCSNCYVSEEWINGKKWSYCPNCGAKMDGE